MARLLTWGGPPGPPPPPPPPAAPGDPGRPPLSPPSLPPGVIPVLRRPPRPGGRPGRFRFPRAARPRRRAGGGGRGDGARCAARTSARRDLAVDRPVLLRGWRAGDWRVHARLRPRALGPLDATVGERPRDARPLDGERGAAGGGGRRPAGHRQPAPVHGLSPRAALFLPQGQPRPARHARRAAVARFCPALVGGSAETSAGNVSAGTFFV